MQMVIDIPEKEYEEIIGSEDCGLHTLTRAIARGTVLPKGHGRLIDADDLYKNTELCHSDIDGYACVRWKDINDAPTIIEADKTVREE